MRQFAAGITSLIMIIAGLSAQGATQRAPQTPRQALMEMFFSKESGTFFKHLPAVTRATLEQAGAMAGLKQYSLTTSPLQTPGKTFQTFETGPVMFCSEDAKTGQKVEAVVNRESLRGDQDDIELTFRTYKDNQVQRTPFMPRVIFSMKKESDLWTLNEISVTINLPLADPDLLKGITDAVKARAVTTASAGPQIHMQSQSQVPTNNFASDSNALADIRKILAAETTYRAAYPTVGYTCTLSDLDGFGAAEANEHQAMLISSSLASGKHQGYTFSLSGCTGPHAASFHLTAAPTGDSYGRRAYCADQSGAIRSSADGQAATCLSSGTPVP
jgi:hypothetical protein